MKKFLKLHAVGNKEIMVDLESITAIEAIPGQGNACTVYCQGLANPLVLQRNPNALFQELIQHQIGQVVQ